MFRVASAPSRREFLKALAVAGAGAILPASGLFAQTAASVARANPRRIDVHHHMNPPVYSQLTPITRNWNWTPARSIEQMDQYDIATAIVSITQPGVWFGNVQQARSLSRACNEYGAQMVRDYPGRFGLFAALPLPDQEGTLREIEYAYDVLKTDGVCLLTSYGDKWLGDSAFAPAFAELNRRKAVVFVHVYVGDCCRNLFPGASPTRAEYDFDTTRTVESLLMSGTLAKFPEVRFIFVHSGGTLPVMAGRINDRVPANRTDLAPQGVMYELKKFYYEVAHGTYAAPLAALTRFVPVSQILFGTDYPAEPIETTTKPLAEFGLSARELQAIDRGNAERLFPRLNAQLLKKLSRSWPGASRPCVIFPTIASDSARFPEASAFPFKRLTLFCFGEKRAVTAEDVWYFALHHFERCCITKSDAVILIPRSGRRI